MPGARFWIRAGLAVARRPWLWWPALRQAFRLVAPGWWRHAPFVPRPDREYLGFRFETAYGGPGGPGRPGAPAVGDFLAYLEWCRRRP